VGLGFITDELLLITKIRRPGCRGDSGIRNRSDRRTKHLTSMEERVDCHNAQRSYRKRQNNSTYTFKGVSPTKAKRKRKEKRWGKIYSVRGGRPSSKLRKENGGRTGRGGLSIRGSRGKRQTTMNAESINIEGSLSSQGLREFQGGDILKAALKNLGSGIQGKKKLIVEPDIEGKREKRLTEQRDYISTGREIPVTVFTVDNWKILGGRGKIWGAFRAAKGEREHRVRNDYQVSQMGPASDLPQA